jgi:hypothetical protein
MARQLTRPQKEIDSILSSFAMIRLLNATALAPMTGAQIAEHLGALQGAGMSRALARLRRHGWIQTTNSVNTITPEGRKALRLATSELRTLAWLTSCGQTRSQL